MISFWTSFIFWSADILVNFNTAVYHHGRLETSKAVIASQYLRSWFVFDVGLVTLDWVVGVQPPTNTGPKPSCSRHAMTLYCIGRKRTQLQHQRHTEGWKHGLRGVHCFVNYRNAFKLSVPALISVERHRLHGNEVSLPAHRASWGSLQRNCNVSASSTAKACISLPKFFVMFRL